MLSGFLTFIYVGALLYGAPILFRNRVSLADTLRGAIVLGIAIPGALALCGVLWTPLLWLALCILCVLRYRLPREKSRPDAAELACLGACMLVLWPALARPVLDGDSLLYHLPIAAAFVHNHSLWTSNAPYWVYPSASELLTSGIFEIGATWSLPVAGMLPALMLAARLYEAARAHGASPTAAASVALAFAFTPVAALQAGTLQNDLWLAAFFVEALAAAQPVMSATVCALLKPFGWIEATLSVIARRVPPRDAMLAFVPLLFWLLRDYLLLLHGARLGFTAPPYWPSTIAANAGRALAALSHAVLVTSPQSFIWVLAIGGGFFKKETRAWSVVGLCAIVVYVFLPLSYSGGGTNYVVDASSWRFALPALACGALIATRFVASSARLLPFVFYGVAAFGAAVVARIFLSDGIATLAIFAAALAAAPALAPPPRRPIAVAIVALAILTSGGWSASARADGFYADWMRAPNGEPTGIFRQITSLQPTTVVAINIRIGSIIAVSAQTQVLAATANEACAIATRNEPALLVLGSNENFSAQMLRDARDAIQRCGHVVYDDASGMIVSMR